MVAKDDVIDNEPDAMSNVAEAAKYDAQGWRAHTRGMVVMAVVLIIWAVLAVRRPHLTYHFAPLIAAAVWPLATRRQVAVPLQTAIRVGVIAFLTVSAFGAALAIGDYLEGPTFFHTRPALVEAVILSALGAAWGTRVAARKATGLFGQIFS